MKVALVIERYDIALGGAERSIFELSAALEKAGLEVDILAAKGESRSLNVHILCGGRKGRTALPEFTSAVREHIDRHNYDIVHCTLPMPFADVYQPRGGTYAETIIRNAASYRNGVIAWLKQGTSWLNLRRLEALRVEKALCCDESGPVIAALSRYVAEQFKAHYGTPDERIEVIPNGIRLEKKPDAESTDKLRGQILVKLGVSEAVSPTVFLFAANNFRLKGLATLLRALSLVSRLKNDHQPLLVVVGSGPSSWYKLLAFRLGVRRRVLFTGRLKNLHGMIAAADIVVLPTFYDPCSRVVLEGLAAGKPVITTRHNGASERYQNERHGIVLEQAGDAAELARAMSFYCTSDNIHKASDAIQEDSLGEEVSIDRHAEQLVKLYGKIMQKRGTK